LEHTQSSKSILNTALSLDKAIEKRNIQTVLSKFSEDCEIELLGIKLSGKIGVRKWMEWQFKHIEKVEFVPVTKMVSENTFFEEFIAKTKLHNEEEILSKQTVVLQFKEDKIKSMRLYFNPIDFADSVVKDAISKTVVKEVIKKSTEGLT
jgi:hypothetical protein